MSLNEDIEDALIRHQIGLQRLSNATVRKIIATLRRSEERIVARLAGDDLSALNRKRQEALLRDLRDILDSAYTDAAGQLQIDLEQLAEYEGEFQGDLFRRQLPVEVNVNRPGPNQIVAAVNSRPFQGRVLKDWYRNLATTAQERLRGTIRQSFVEGRTVGEIVREVRGTRANGYKDGILALNYRQAEAIVRTSINHTANTARNEIYRANRGILKGVQWSATLDGRTTLICMARDGKVYPPDKGPRPPAHFNCRSTTVPIVKGWQGLGLKGLPPATRASMNGQEPGGVDYGTWLRRQPAAFQDEVLGETKGALFRRGDLPIDRFVNDKGREYTLDELRRREADAWAKANI